MADKSALLAATPRKVMTLFLLIDCSGSMEVFGNIEQVNNAVGQIVSELGLTMKDSSEAEIKIAVLTFSNDCRWVGSRAVSLEEFNWLGLRAGGVTNMGAAFTELESKLHKSAFLASATGAYAPVIILLSDGMPSDEWEKPLDELKKNNWFKIATKIAIAVDGGDIEGALPILAEFTGSADTVLQVEKLGGNLERLLRELAVVSSTMQSRSAPVDAKDAEAVALKTVGVVTGARAAEDAAPEQPQPEQAREWDFDNW